jgi:hypothetical protein
MKDEAPGTGIENRVSHHVCRQEVASKLEATKIEPERLGKRLGKRGLTDAWHILQEQMSPSQNARHCQPDNVRFTDDHCIQLSYEAFNV